MGRLQAAIARGPDSGLTSFAVLATPVIVAGQILAVLIELFRWRLEGPLGWLWPTSWDPKPFGAAAMISLVVAMLVARWAHYHSVALLGFVHLAATGLAAVLLPLHLRIGNGGGVLLLSPDSAVTTGQSGPPSWLVRVAIATLIAPFLVKLLQLQRLANRWRARDQQAAAVELLPSQEMVAQRIVASVTAQDVGSAGQVVQLRGRWGDGKTFILRQVTARLAGETVMLPTGEARSTAYCAPVWIDVWEHEGVSDLHAETVDTLLSHPLHSRRLRWLGFPVTFGRRMLSGIRVRAKFQAAELEIPLTLPPLPYQRGLERSLKRSGAVGVLVLDEIDRASPLAAQTVLTLLRRSMDLPRVTVIVPYVERVLLFKAFSPYVQQLPDLESMLRASMVLAGLWPPPVGTDEHLRATEIVSGANDRGDGPETSNLGMQAVWSKLFALAFSDARPEDRSRTQRYAASKMIDSRPIEMPLIRLPEVGNFLAVSRPVRAILERLINSVPKSDGTQPSASDPTVSEVSEYVRDQLPGLVGERPTPPLRSLQAWLLALLDIYAPPPPTFEAMLEFVAVATAAAVAYCPDE